METRKTIWMIALITALIVATVLSATALSITISVRKSVENLTSSSKGIEAILAGLNADRLKNDENTVYLLKEHKGIIGIFDMEGNLTDIINVNVKSLPQQDRIMLKAGIWAFSEQELSSLIEDYSD